MPMANKLGRVMTYNEELPSRRNISYIVKMVGVDNIIQQKIMETIINMQRKNCKPVTDAIYIELTNDCASNISAHDIESQINLLIDNGMLENRPSNQGLDSFLI